MPLLNAIGSSLVSVTAFGAATSSSYAMSGLVDWRIAGLFVVGGVFGGILGTILAKRLAAQRQTLNYVFAGIVIAVGVSIMLQGVRTLWNAGLVS